MKVIWETIRQTVRRRDLPSQLALGVALGMMIGILPQDSLLPWAIALCALLSPANLLTTVLTAFTCSMLGSTFDSIAHPIGQSLLTAEATGPILHWLQQLPVVAWSRLDNTVVTGLLALGTLASLPSFLVSLGCFRRFYPARNSDTPTKSVATSPNHHPTILES